MQTTYFQKLKPVRPEVPTGTLTDPLWQPQLTTAGAAAAAPTHPPPPPACYSLHGSLPNPPPCWSTAAVDNTTTAILALDRVVAVGAPIHGLDMSRQFVGGKECKTVLVLRSAGAFGCHFSGQCPGGEQSSFWAGPTRLRKRVFLCGVVGFHPQTGFSNSWYQS